MSTSHEMRLVVKYFGPLLRKKEGATKMMQELVTGSSGAAKRAPLPATHATSKTRVDSKDSHQQQSQQPQSNRAYSTEARPSQRNWTLIELSTAGSLTAEELERFWATSA